MKGRTKLLVAILATLCIFTPAPASAMDAEASGDLWSKVVSWFVQIVGADSEDQPQPPATLPAPDGAAPEVSIAIPPCG